MIVIETQRHFRAVADLPFCYWCGRNFSPQDQANGDHVPPRNAFAVGDRTPPLILKTHVICNNVHKTTDELIGQLVALQRNYVTPDPADRRLKMEVYPGQEFGAVTNVNVIEAVWRYIRGFHAALYREPLLLDAQAGTITTPFTRGRIVDGDLVLEGPKREQHFAIVQAIKKQRAVANVDRIVSNNGKITYECVWVWADDMSAVECRIELHGDAFLWWAEAAGRYARGWRPELGSLLAFRSIPRMPLGHLAVVVKIISSREILVSQANWVPDTVTRNVPVIDVSPENNWTEVRQSVGGGRFGMIYPTYGFIYDDPLPRTIIAEGNADSEVAEAPPAPSLRLVGPHRNLQ